MAGRRGAIMIIVLWAIAVLALLCSGLCFVVGQDRMLSMFERDRVAAHWLARAGVEQSLAVLIQDAAESSIDDDAELWAKDDTLQAFAMSTGVVSVMRDDYDDLARGKYGASDESAKLNVVSATREQLMKLPHMTASVAAAIIDWRDDNEQPEQEGVEGGYYAMSAHPYTIRNGAPRTVRELLLVRGVTPDLFWGEDVNGNGVLDENENDGNTNAPEDNADGRLDRGWFAYLTVFSYEKNVDGKGNKRVNVNKADAGTLTSRLQLEDWAAQSIIKQRDKGEFKHLADLLDVKLDASVKRGSREQDVNERSDEQQNTPVTSSVFERIADLMTLEDKDVLPGRVNLNTAPAEVLKTLLDDETVEAVVQKQKGGGYLRSIGELLSLDGMNKEKFAAVESSVTVRSSVFRIYSEGQAGSGVREHIECVVDRGADKPRVLYWMESVP